VVTDITWEVMVIIQDTVVVLLKAMFPSEQEIGNVVLMAVTTTTSLRTFLAFVVEQAGLLLLLLLNPDTQVQWITTLLTVCMVIPWVDLLDLVDMEAVAMVDNIRTSNTVDLRAPLLFLLEWVLVLAPTHLWDLTTLRVLADLILDLIAVPRVHLLPRLRLLLL